MTSCHINFGNLGAVEVHAMTFNKAPIGGLKNASRRLRAIKNVQQNCFNWISIPPLNNGFQPPSSDHLVFAVITEVDDEGLMLNDTAWTLVSSLQHGSKPMTFRRDWNIILVNATTFDICATVRGNVDQTTVIPTGCACGFKVRHLSLSVLV
jgi:hypothetical protein